MDCGKACLTRIVAVAHALASPTYRRVYYCGPCRAWHTTSKPRRGGTEPPQYLPRFKGPMP